MTYTLATEADRIRIESVEDIDRVGEEGTTRRTKGEKDKGERKKTNKRKTPTKT